MNRQPESPLILRDDHATDKPTNVDIVWMDFSAGAALDFESVPEVVLRRVIWPEISHPSSVSLVRRLS